MIVDKMQNLNNFTFQEQAAVEHIIKHPKDLLEMSVTELAEASYTSASTIIRLCKKLGTKGYADLKFIYASEYPEMMNFKESLRTKPYDKSSEIDDIINTMPLIYSKAINHTRSMLDRNTLIKVTNLIKQATVIDVYGDGINYEVAKMFCYKLEEIGVMANACNSIQWNHCKILQTEKIPTYSILISHTGKNPSIYDAAKRLKEYGIPTLSISGNIDQRLSKLTDDHIHIMTSENTLEFSTVIFTMSTQYILDIIVASLLVYRYDSVAKNVTALKEERSKWLKNI
ncbi:MurR/RpiR family transcriptional regulator [Clostridium vincentii]|uniref:Putative HTH-type transcriptional regulator YbbH n=1 Tax=Clostridium vincentii TaxID=52704 RepID=A0A2T0B740_9CLOT|nr:MurR/RpiR family transcriptional regulator [Clostridium vincentii]PRR79718.1 putative HTH-type transcriptional regulator YbbH [Clostridium vincentii]